MFTLIIRIGMNGMLTFSNHQSQKSGTQKMGDTFSSNQNENQVRNTRSTVQLIVTDNAVLSFTAVVDAASQGRRRSRR